MASFRSTHEPVGAGFAPPATPPTDGSGDYRPASEAVKVTRLPRRARHRWRLHPALEQRGGELFWAPGRRGDVPARCLKHGERRTFHPFTARPDPLAVAA